MVTMEQVIERQAKMFCIGGEYYFELMQELIELEDELHKLQDEQRDASDQRLHQDRIKLIYRRLIELRDYFVENIMEEGYWEI